MRLSPAERVNSVAGSAALPDGALARGLLCLAVVASRKMAFEQRMDIVLTYWHWLEYDSVALATLFTGIGLVALLVLSI